MRRPVWLTVNVFPAIVTVPLRVETSFHGATVTVTVPSPVPDVGETESQSAFGRAFHDTPAVASAVTSTAPPSDPTSAAYALSSAPTPAWVMVWTCPLTYTYPTRSSTPLFAVTP